jgi:hypothetical protein
VGRGLGMGERRRGGALASDSGRGGGAAIERIEAIVGFNGGGLGHPGPKLGHRVGLHRTGVVEARRTNTPQLW